MSVGTEADAALAEAIGQVTEHKDRIAALEEENARLKEEIATALADREDALNTLLEVQELVETRHAQLTDTERVLEYERELREEARATFLAEDPEG